MEVDDHGVRLALELGELSVGLGERRAGDPKLHGAAQVEHRDAPPSGLDGRRAAPGVSGRIVGGADHAVAPIQELVDRAVTVDVVAGGDHVDADLEHLVGRLLGDPEAPGRVLAIRDHEVRRVAPAKLGHRRGEPDSAGAADDVADEQDSHGRESLLPPSTAGRGEPTRAVPLRTARIGSLRRQLIGGPVAAAAASSWRTSLARSSALLALLVGQRLATAR